MVCQTQFTSWIIIKILFNYFPFLWTPRTIVQTLLVTRTLWGRCDLLVFYYYISVLFIILITVLGVWLNWRLPLFFQPDLLQQSSQSPSSSRHRPPGPPPSPGRAASHPLREQMDVVAADACAAFLIALYFIIVRCFTDKFSFKATRLSLSVDSG